MYYILHLTNDIVCVSVLFGCLAILLLHHTNIPIMLESPRRNKELGKKDFFPFSQSSLCLPVATTLSQRNNTTTG